MGRGLDGFFDTRCGDCVVLKAREGTGAQLRAGCRGDDLRTPDGPVSHRFPVAMARGKHLFPFRTEQLSPSAPMVLGLKGPGRVGRRRFT